MEWLLTGVFATTTLLYGVSYHKQVELTIKERMRPYQ
jgi:hypothetical protein